MVTPRQVCTQTPSSRPDADSYYGEDSMCAMKRHIELNEDEPACFKMSCDDKDTLTVYAKEKAIVCTEAGKEFELSDNYKGVCPDPKIICGIRNYGKNYPPNPDGEGGSSGGGSGSGGSGGKGGGGSSGPGGGDGPGGDSGNSGRRLSDGAIAGIVIGVVAVVGIVVAIVVVVKKGIVCGSAQVVPA